MPTFTIKLISTLMVLCVFDRITFWLDYAITVIILSVPKSYLYYIGELNYDFQLLVRYF